MNQRLKRINELLKREISLVLQKEFVFDDALVTVNCVEITQDLKNAQVFLGIIGSDVAKANALHLLKSKRGLVQGRISRRVILKHTAQLHFKTDDSVERGVNLLSIIDSIEIPEDLSADDGADGPPEA